MKQASQKAYQTLLAVCLLVVLFPWAKAAAQDEPAPTPTPQEQQTLPSVSVEKDQAPPQAQEQAPVDDQSYKAPVNLITGQSLKSTRSPLHWGHFSLLSVDAIQVYDSNYLFRENDPLSAQAGAIQGLLVYAVQTGRTNFSVQYRPQVWMSAETTQADYSSHLVDFQTSHRSSPRWSYNISDQYQWSADRGRLDQVSFTADYSTSRLNQNPFLTGSRRLISNMASASVDHNFTAHSSLEFAARHQYIQLSDLPSDVPASQDPLTSQTKQQIFGGEVAWNYAWRHENSLGLRYIYDREYFHGYTGASQFHSALFGFSRRLRPSLLLRVSGGPSVILPATPPGTVTAPDAQLTYQASAALLKTFRRSGITLSYSRNNYFTGQISDALNDRVDASYSQRFFRRADALIGAAFVRQNYSTGAPVKGKTGWAEIDYHLSPSWSFYATYSYFTQNGGPVLFGDRHLVASGLRWSWDAGRREGYRP